MFLMTRTGRMRTWVVVCGAVESQIETVNHNTFVSIEGSSLWGQSE